MKGSAMTEFGPAVQMEERPVGPSGRGPEDDIIDHETIDQDTQWEVPPAPDGGAGGWGNGPWQPTPSEPGGSAQSPRQRGLAVLAIAAMAFASGGVGVAIGANLHHRLSSPAASAFIPLPGASASPGVAAPGSALPSTGNQPSTGAPSTGSASIDPSAIAAAVDPAIVDINTTLTNGEAAGTGMVLTSSGLVLTNNHVI